MVQLVPGAWTQEQSNALVEYVKCGLSYKQSADAINERFGTTFTRNSAVGRGHRLGLVGPERPKPARPKKERREYQPRRTITRIVRANGNSDAMRMILSTEATGAKLRCVEITPRNLSLIDLEPGDCRYPYGGESEGEAITFCGHPKRDKSSFCTPHHFLCWEAPRKRADKYFSRRAA
jgi:GcrA cell cycle regulator